MDTLALRRRTHGGLRVDTHCQQGQTRPSSARALLTTRRAPPQLHPNADLGIDADHQHARRLHAEFANVKDVFTRHHNAVFASLDLHSVRERPRLAVKGDLAGDQVVGWIRPPQYR